MTASISNAMTNPMTMASPTHAIPAGGQSAPALNRLLLVVALLLTLGLLMMTSASVEIASERYGDPFYLLRRQAVFAGMGLFVMLITLHLPMGLWRNFSGILLLVSLLLLILVLIPGVGHAENGSRRWIDLGLFDLQPSEPGKVFIVVYMAAYLERRLEEVRNHWSGFLKPMLVIGAAVMLLHFEPDHGAMVILLLTTFCMIFLAGAKFYRFLVLLLLGAGAVAYVATKKDYIIGRLSAYLEPWAAENVYDAGYQLTQAQIAFGRGEWFGVGLGNSIQKLHFLPEAHNDFVLAIIGEELGLAGVSLVVVLFCILVYSGFAIAMRAQEQGQLFNGFVAYGLSLLFAGQALINIGVNIGLLPTKGLTLPFLSQGGASLIVSCFMAALLLRIHFEVETGTGQTTKDPVKDSHNQSHPP